MLKKIKLKNLNISPDTSIGSEEYKKFPKAYKFALREIEREVHQAVEALYHNLNTLQSRSGKI